jgi:hypothetical protein
MKKLLLLLAFPVMCHYTSFSQLTKVDDVKKSLETTNKDTIAWAHGGVLNLAMNEGFLHNWAAGGELASVTINGIFSGHLDRLHNREIWSNNLDLSYGLAYAYSTSFIPHKTDDRIDFTSKYGVRMDSSKRFYFTGLFNFKSQFNKGYDYTLTNWQSLPNSDFFAPAYFTTALGIEYRKGSDLSVFVSPLAGRLTMASKYYTDLSPTGAFGIPYGKTQYYQFGAYFSGRDLFHFNKKVTYKTRLDLYSNYLAKDTKDSTGRVIKRDNPGNISVLFDNLLSYKVSKALNITIGATFIYDNNFPYVGTYVDSKTGLTTTKEDPGSGIGWLQVKQIFALGLEFKF